MFKRKENLEKETEPTEMKVINIEEEAITWKLTCECTKDPKYKFGCKHSIKWFVNNLLLTKIRKKQSKNPEIDVSKIITEEYMSCK